MNEQEVNAQLDRIQGELLATQAAIRALLMSHPDPSAAIAQVHSEVEKLAALGLARSVSDATLEGMTRARNVFFPRELPRREAGHP